MLQEWRLWQCSTMKISIRIIVGLNCYVPSVGDSQRSKCLSLKNTAVSGHDYFEYYIITCDIITDVFLKPGVAWLVQVCIRVGFEWNFINIVSKVSPSSQILVTSLALVSISFMSNSLLSWVRGQHVDEWNACENDVLKSNWPVIIGI